MVSPSSRSEYIVDRKALLVERMTTKFDSVKAAAYSAEEVCLIAPIFNTVNCLGE